MSSTIKKLDYRLPEGLAASVAGSLADWERDDKVRKLWAHDAAVWTNADEANWLGWLDIVEGESEQSKHLTDVADDVKQAGFSHALLLGMGGSSLCPEVMTTTFGKQDGFPELHVLDSTDPAQIKSFEAKVDLANTLFIVSSKSGSTLEPNIYKDYFFDRVKQVVGDAEVGRRFIAITDPGSKLQSAAEEAGFRHIFFGLPTIGGRYSALSDFGLVPAAIMGLDVVDLLTRAREMVRACGTEVRAAENPGVVLGTILGVLHEQGRDKVTIVASPGIYDLGAWLEQLLAESTGKVGRGLIPVDREELGKPEVYGSDRLFVYLRLVSAADAKQDAAIETLEQAGQPVVRISLPERRDIVQEFFRWEFATAVAGSIIGINAFNQPDVEESKIATRQLTEEYERDGALPAEKPIAEDASLRLFTDEKNASALALTLGDDRSITAYLRAHLGRLAAGDYFGLLAYIQMNAAHEQELQTIRHLVRDTKRVATCLGFGPRFLHSTGQAYKGGPNSGVFLQVTCDDAIELPVPGKKYTFGVVKAAQALGDFRVLAKRDRRVLRVHLGQDVAAGLETLRALIEQVLVA